jgi:hypothetical protein
MTTTFPSSEAGALPARGATGEAGCWADTAVADVWAAAASTTAASQIRFFMDDSFCNVRTEKSGFGIQ